MEVRVEGTDQKLINHVTKDQLIQMLSELKKQRTEKSTNLAYRIEQYEKKRMAEEIMYRSLSPIRKLIMGKRPDHHLAVEYMVYVKRPLQEIDELSLQIRLIEQLENRLVQDGQDTIYVPPFLLNELLKLYTNPAKGV